jgi:hypothetical protein
MDFYSAHTCTLQSIIHDKCSLQKETAVISAGGSSSLRRASVWSKNSCSLARVVFQQSPKPFATLNWVFAIWLLADRQKEQHVALTLMIPLVVKMLRILRFITIYDVLCLPGQEASLGGVYRFPTCSPAPRSSWMSRA